MKCRFVGSAVGLVLMVLSITIPWSASVHELKKEILEDDYGVPCHSRNPCKCFNHARAHANLTVWEPVTRKNKKSTRCYLAEMSNCEFAEFHKSRILHGWCSSSKCNTRTLRCTKFIPPLPGTTKVIKVKKKKKHKKSAADEGTSSNYYIWCGAVVVPFLLSFCSA